MIITSDIRAAIRSAEKVQPNRRATDWDLKELRNKRAIKALVSKPEHAEKLKQADADYAEGQRLCGLANAAFSSLGIDHERRHICNEEKFLAAGGILPPKDGAPWKFDKVMAELLSAKTEKEGVKVLAKYGIIWTIGR